MLGQSKVASGLALTRLTFSLGEATSYRDAFGVG